MLGLQLADSAKPPRILCLGAHSDDIEIGCGGTMLRLLRTHPNAAVHWVVFGTEGDRAKEARDSAARYLNDVPNAHVQIEAYPNSFFPEHWSAIKSVFERDIKPFEPTVVFTHYREDRHQDHRVISDLTWNTFRDQLILEYEIPKFDGDLGQPNLFVPLAKSIVDQKVRALMDMFDSQRSKHWFSEETFRGLMRLRGMESAEHFAEAFYGRKVVWSAK